MASLILDLTKTPGQACIIYPRSVVAGKYTKVKYIGKSFLAHRLSLQLNLGSPPSNKHYACHKCNNPPCINPTHLYWGTPSDNTSDAIAAGTTQRGEKNVTAKLTRDMVLRIRTDDRSCRLIGQEYGITAAQVSLIRNRKTWSWL